jgi:hypothetical protein
MIKPTPTPPSETLASARTIAHDFAHLVPASQHRTLLVIAQLIMLGELAVNRVMNNLELPTRPDQSLSNAPTPAWERSAT